MKAVSRVQKNTLSLDNVRVQHRAIEAREPITLHLPVPPSVNNLFINLPGRGRVPSQKYKQWRQDAAATLWTQPRKFMGGRVSVTLRMTEKARPDGDNFWKATLDFLVQHNFIAGDSKKFVREHHFYWADVEGAVITIERAA